MSSTESIAHAAGIALLYVEETFGHDLAHIAAPRLYRSAEYMLVDETTRRHLELIASTDGARKGSLLSVLDETLTAVGARTLANWIIYPLLALDAIRARHDAVEELFDADLGGTLAESLKRIGDLERLAGRIGACARHRAIVCAWARRSARQIRSNRRWARSRVR